MFEKSCRCGTSKKRFRVDIGPFFVNECCAAAGFDDLGQKPGDTSALREFFGLKVEPKVSMSNPPQVAPKTIGRGKLMDMTVPALKELAASKGTTLDENMNKKAIVAAIMR